MATQSNDTDLKDLLTQVGDGKLKLPEFQRSWVWDDTKICKLIESVTMGYPMGALMFLETGGESDYKPRLFTNVDESRKDVKPEFLVLDGQQRLTTLYQVFMSEKPVVTCLERSRKRTIKRYYYLDVVKALDKDTDREDAIISISETKTKTIDIGRTIELDLSTREKEFEEMMFPLNLLYSFDCQDWLWNMVNYHKEESEKYNDIRQRFWKEIIAPIESYKLPVIKVLKDTPLESVCQIFENVNRGGVPLDVFDLVTASLAAHDIELRKEWEAIKKDFGKQQCKLLKDVDGTAFLTSMTLWDSYEKFIKDGTGVKCKKKDVMKLTSSVFVSKKEGMKQAFLDAANFLMKEGIYSADNVPYTTQLVPLAAIYAYDKSHKGFFDNHTNISKLERWYWSGVFGELYGGANESRYAMDIRDFFAWVENDEVEPNTVNRSNFQATRLLTLQTRNSAAYKGVMALILKKGPLDFATAQSMPIATFALEKTDIHHIFPADYCKKSKLDIRKWNSIVNKTMINASTNRSIGGKAPSEYIQKLFNGKANVEAEYIKNAIRSHMIDFDLLNEDNFDEFINDRAIKLLDLIEEATGKPITDRDSKETIEKYGASLVKPI